MILGDFQNFRFFEFRIFDFFVFPIFVGPRGARSRAVQRGRDRDGGELTRKHFDVNDTATEESSHESIATWTTARGISHERYRYRAFRRGPDRDGGISKISEFSFFW